MKYPNIIKVEHVIQGAGQVSAHVNGRWVPARGHGFATLGNRLRATWLVFTGKADALLWEGQ